MTSRRLVSFRDRSVAAICYEVEALDAPMRVALQSNLLANQQDTASDGDPRAAADLGDVLESRLSVHDGLRVVLAHTTRESGLSLAAGMEHVIDAEARAADADRERGRPRAGHHLGAADSRAGRCAW